MSLLSRFDCEPIAPELEELPEHQANSASLKRTGNGGSEYLWEAARICIRPDTCDLETRFGDSTWSRVGEVLGALRESQNHQGFAEVEDESPKVGELSE
jgi:hypothetical protein